MATQAERLVWRHLRPDEVNELPANVKAGLGDACQPEEEWILLRARDAELGKAVDRAIRILDLQWASRRPDRQRQSLDRMLDLLVTGEDAPRSAIEANLLMDNLELRADYLRETGTLTSEEIHNASGLQSRNVSEPASRWKREGRIFAVRQGRADRYPAFQFRDGAPHPTIRDVLSALPGGMTSWQTGLWFASGNGWLDGDPPQRRLDDRDQVVYAARQLAEPASG